ncbi:MAG: helix-turn-helix domain-containing protein [Methanospirillum sp.]
MATSLSLPVLEKVEADIAKLTMATEELNKTTSKNLEIINEAIRDIVYTLRIQAAEMDASGFKPSFIFDLPDHLRTTMRTLMDLGEATAEDISQQTDRSRSLESAYLNTLTNMGYLEKRRKGQLVYYKITFK